MKSHDCLDIKALLSGLVDGELDAPTLHLAERHLADCAPCRSLVSRTERLGEMIVSDAQRMAGPAELPSGFQDAVLARTVYASAYHHAGHRWTSWLGWVAAAACLGLASTIWFLDRQGFAPDRLSRGNLPRQLNGSGIEEALPAAERSAYVVSGKSWLYEGGLPAQSVSFRSDDDSSFSTLDDNTLLAIDRNLDGDDVFEVNAAALSEDDAQTISAARTLLDILAAAEPDSFADADRVRQIALYDDLLPRLEASRSRLSPEDRPMLLAAESILLRVVQGPLSLGDLQFMRETLTSLQLSERLGRIGWRPSIASSL